MDPERKLRKDCRHCGAVLQLAPILGTAPDRPDVDADFDGAGGSAINGGHR